MGKSDMRMLVLVGVLVASALPALAAEPFNITGSWVPTYRAAAWVGTHPGGAYSSAKPTLSNDVATAWSYTFDQQQGGAFSGYVVGPTGSKETVVGAFHQDGRRFVLSTDFGSAAGEVTGDGIELCWTDNVPNFNEAGCQTYKRK